MDNRDQDQPMRMPWYGTERHYCFGCSGSNPAGLALSMIPSGDTLTTNFVLTRIHESYPGLIHGGVSAAILDELMGNLLVYKERKLCFTTSLRLAYAGALRIGQSYSAIAWLQEPGTESKGVFRVLGKIRDAEGSALVLARGNFRCITLAGWHRALGLENAPGDDLAPYLCHDESV